MRLEASSPMVPHIAKPVRRREAAANAANNWRNASASEYCVQVNLSCYAIYNFSHALNCTYGAFVPSGAAGDTDAVVPGL